ncbi:TPA: hypothetical protein KRE78_001014 [Clostridioides difficile]|nr:hypothetical protein [Clostridioides difficile]
MSLIKYRGYDFENEKWIYSETIKWSDAVDCLFMLKENCEWQKVSNIGVFSKRWSGNNEEIYEGDILKVPYDKNEYEYGIVRQENYALGLYVEWHYLKQFEGKWEELTSKTTIMNSKEYIVVGNECENLEEVRKEFLECKEMLENEHLG